MKMELLSPVGNMSSLIASVQSGADAVYLGGNSFGARQSANNFDEDALKLAIDYAHLRGVKVYLTVNTLIKDNEINGLIEFVKMAYLLGVDAFIVQDIGVLSIVRSIIPEARIHASTQMSVHNLDGLKALENLGVKRVVLARELSEEQIEHICKNTNMEIEIFVHGAICVSESGQCLMSSIIGGRSGNRGRCAQPCRLNYELMSGDKQVENGYLLSPKDMCLIDHIKELEKAGVTSLKIEGRLKRSEYVMTVTSIYRKYIDTTSEVNKQDEQTLIDAFNRSGFTDGYFENKLGKEMMTIENPSNVSENKFDEETTKYIDENANFRKIDIKMYVTLEKEAPLSLTVMDSDDNCVSVVGDILPQIAINREIDEALLYKQLSKLGDVPFKIADFDAKVEGGLSLSIKDINEVRRKAIIELSNIRTKVDRKINGEFSFPQIIQKQKELPRLTAEVYNIEQLKAVLKYDVAKIYAREEIYDEAKKLIDSKCELVLKLADVDYDLCKKNNQISDDDNLLVSNIGAINKYENTIYGDWRLNVFNSVSANAYSEMGFNQLVLSPELNIRQIDYLNKRTNTKTEIIGYGHIPLMLMKNCPIKCYDNKKCRNHNNNYLLRDRYKEKFPIITDCDNCVAIILNSKPIFMADKLSDLKNININYIKLLFTVENFSTCDKIMLAYENSMNNNKVEPLDNNTFTRGHFYRGVE